MQLPAPSNTLQKIFNICLALMCFFFVANIVLGVSLKIISRDIKELELFLASAESVRPNFEESLNLYTQGTEEAIAYVDTLRPDTETEYIQFISSVEAIAQTLSLNIDLESLEADKPDNLGSTLSYRIDFFGGQMDLMNFLKELEALPYYIRVKEMRYESYEAMRVGEDSAPNVILTIELYVK